MQVQAINYKNRAYICTEYETMYLHLNYNTLLDIVRLINVYRSNFTPPGNQTLVEQRGGFKVVHPNHSFTCALKVESLSYFDLKLSNI